MTCVPLGWTGDLSRDIFCLKLSLFFFKGIKELVENSNIYTLTFITRDAAGEYKCSLADDEKMMASKHIAVNCECSVCVHFLLNVTLTSHDGILKIQMKL